MSLVDRLTRAEIEQEIATAREIARRAEAAAGAAAARPFSCWVGGAVDELEQLRRRVHALEQERRELRDELRTERAARLQVEENASLLRHALILLAPKGPDDAG
jgi:hypothetical protein